MSSRRLKLAGLGFHALIIALRYTESPVQCSLAVLRNRVVQCRIKSIDRARATLGRSNILLVPSMISCEKSAQLRILHVTEKWVEVSVRDGEKGSVRAEARDLIDFMKRVESGQKKLSDIRNPIEIKEGLSKLIREDRIRLLSLKGETISCRIPSLDMTLSGPLDEVAESVAEFVLTPYYSDFEVLGRVVVDIGGFIGDSTLFFVSRGAKKVYMYEPRREYFEVAKRNLASFGNVFIENCGVGCVPGEARLVGSGRGGRTVDPWHDQGEVVQIRSLNSILEEILSKEQTIGLFKIDCEGCEWELSRCLDEKLFFRIESIYLEVHGGNHRKILKRFEGLGFRVKSTKIVPDSSHIAIYLLGGK